MKHLKMLGLLVVAAASMMAFASNASATAVLTSPAGTEYTGTIHATLATPNTAVLKAGIEEVCGESTVHGTVTVNNASGATGSITSPGGLTFGDCEAGGDTTVLSVGSLDISDTGVVTATGSEVTVKKFGISCVYGGSTGTKLGTLTTGSTASLNVNTTELPKISGGAFCLSKGTWTAKYTVTTPDSLFLT